MKNLLSKAFLAFLFVVAAGMTTSAQNINLSESIPIDPNVTKGHLDNGLTYYIRPNAKPADKVELRLVINAGSILETDEQQGLAHFMEHMNFNGLKHFPKHELVDYLQNIGVKFGADLNANTGFDRTYFILPIPTDQSGNLQKGFQIIADWAGGALITDEEVNAERKVVFEELRMRDKNASTRMMKQYLPELLNGSRYAKRLPIGTKEVIMNADPELIRQFYHDWYRPNNMAVIVVGDITTEKAEQMIKEYFGDLKNPKNEKERVEYEVKPYTQPKAMVVTDHEATGYSFQLLFPAHKRQVEKTLKDYRESLVRGIFRLALNHNLSKKTQTANPPYAGAYASLSGAFGSFTINDEGFSLGVTPIDNFKKSIDAAVAELLQVRQYGFTKQDIENTKKKFMAFYEKAYKERDKMLSASIVDQYAGNFMSQEPIPGIANEYAYAKAMLPTITAEEVSKLAQGILANSKNFFALITAPKEGKITLPSNEQLLATVQEAFKQQVEAPKETKVAKKLLAKAPVAGTIKKTKANKDLGSTTYTLSNGVKVTVKNTDFKSDQIIFKGVKFGGSNSYGAADKSNTNFLTTIISTMGYGQFTPTALRDYLSGKTVHVGMSMGSVSNNVSGSSSVQDFETLLKLNYLKLTDSRLDKDLFKGFMTKMKTRVENIKANPQSAFIDSLITVMYGNDPLTPIAVPTEESLNNIELNRVLDIYNSEFGYADGFHFFIVGNVDQVDVKPLIEKYIASLPVKGETPKYVDNGLRRIQGDNVFKFYKGNNDKSLILSLFYGENVKYSEENALKADLLGQMMTMQITDTIREKMQVIYSGGASASISDRPYTHYSVMMQLPTGPESVQAILDELKSEFKGYKTDGGPKGALAKAQKATLESHKENLKKNSYWANKLESILVWNRSKKFFLNFDKEVNAITLKDIIKTANTLLEGNHFTAISYPESYRPE